MTPPARRPAVVVLGLMGAGKSTLARALADVLAAPLRDSDADLAAATGRTAAELAEEDGTEALHALEHAHLRDALARTSDEGERPVVAAAASLGDREDLAALTRDALVVWVRGDPTLLARRHGHGEHRPDLGDPLAVLRAHAERRDPRFAAVADVVVAADAPQATQLAAVLAALDTTPWAP